MPANLKTEMYDNLRAYREAEFDRMKNIISKEEIQTNFSSRRQYVCRYLVVLMSHDFLWDSEEISLLNVEYVNYLLDLISQDDSHMLALIGMMSKESLLRVLETF